MFQNMLAVQWRWSRWSTLLLSIAAVVLPIWTVSAPQRTSGGLGSSALANRLESANSWYHLLVVVAGFLLAMHAWRTDHAGRHVYALSLPIARWRFVLYRYGVGVLCAGVIVVALWLSALVAGLTADVPPGLHVYATGLALRIAIALLTAYAVFFAVWGATPRTGYYVAAAVVLLFLITTVPWSPFSVLRDALASLWNGVGFQNIFAGRWFLIDV